jgi:hypothetical protein
MKLVSIPANPVPDDAVTGMLKTPDGVALRFARFAPPAGRRGSVCHLIDPDGHELSFARPLRSSV